MSKDSYNHDPVDSLSKDESRAPWNAALGLIYIVAAFFGGQIIAGIALIGLVRLLLGHGEQAHTFANSPTFQFLLIAAAETLTIWLVYIYLKRFRLNLSFIGLKKPKLYHPLLGVLAVPLYYLLFGVLIFIATRLFPGLNVSQKQELGFDNVVGVPEKILTFLGLVIFAPLAEEIVFRGFLYKTLRKTMPIWVATLVTSVLFGAGHLAEGGSSGPLYVGAIQTFSLSLVLVWLYQKTGNLWAGIVLHASNNLIAFIFLFVVGTH